MDLVLNARDAMPKGGRVTIESAIVDLDGAYVRRHADALPGPHVMVAVSDTGDGMDEATLARAIEPFFTTRPVGQGTGLGLAMVYGFVRQSGGTISIYSEPGRGTTVKMYLPLTTASAHEPPACQDAPSLHRSSGTILIVEDEDAIRTIIVETLRECGYVVHDVSGAEQALARLSGGIGPVDLLVTDVVMPGMDGSELARCVQAAGPAVRVL